MHARYKREHGSYGAHLILNHEGREVERTEPSPKRFGSEE